MPSARSVCSRIVCPAPRRVGGVAVAVDQRPLGRRAAVVEDRLADELDLDAALEALDRAHEHVVGVVVGRRARVRRDRVLVVAGPDRQRVAHDDPAGRRLPGRLEHVRARLVGARGRVVDPERPEAEGAGLAVEQAAEHARRVEARDAEPVDRAVGRDQRARVAVGQERVVGDRRERRRRGGALRAAARVSARRRVMPSPTARASRRGRRPARRPPPAPTIPARRGAPAAARRAAAA